MKRFISLFLVASVLIFSFAIPSYAVEDSWFDVLDYTTPNNSGSNMVTVSSGDTVTFDVPVIEAAHFDFVLQFRSGITSLAVSTSIPGYTVNFNVIKINDYTYRCYGYAGIASDSLPITINFTSSVSTIDVTFLSFKLSEVYFYSQDVPVNGIAYFHGNINSSFTYNGSTVSISIPGSSYADQDDVRIYLDINDWAKYDYLELYLVAREMSINSIAATLSSEVVPCSVSYINSVGTSDEVYFTVTVDLTGLSRDSALPLDIAITGTSIYLDSLNGSFGIFFASGFLETAGVSKFAQFRYFLTSWFSNIGSWISNQTTTIGSFFDYYFAKFDPWFTNLTTSIGSFFDYYIGKIGTWIESQTSSLVTNLEYYLNKVDTSINSWGQKIYDAIIGDSNQIQQNETIGNATQQQEQINQELNVQLDSAIQDWNDNFDSVSGGYNTGFTKSTPALIWLSDKAQSVFNNMGWFGNMFFFLGFLHVFFLLMSKSGLGQAFKQKNGDD